MPRKGTKAVKRRGFKSAAEWKTDVDTGSLRAIDRFAENENKFGPYNFDVAFVFG